MPRVRPRARQSRYRRGSRPARLLSAAILAAVVGGVLLGVSYATVRTATFLHSVARFDAANPVQVVSDAIEPPEGSIAWKLKYGERINILAVGYGGAENDAPWLTDSILVISIDPPTRRIIETSIPRDLWVSIDAWPDGRALKQKINAAFEVGNEPRVWSLATPLPQYQGQDGAAHLVEHVISARTGLVFDHYIGVDFKAFRDAVDALGGIEVQMTGPLNDCHYPSYGHGYINRGVPVGYACPPGAGIHYPAGVYHVNGEQALELARSRDAIEPDQSSDFGRSRRQQMIIAAIRRQATGTGAIFKAPQLMSALQGDFKTDLTLADIKALYDFASTVGESDILHLAVTDQNLVSDYGPGSAGSCGDVTAFVLCADDPTYRIWQALFGRMFIPVRTLNEHAAIQLVNSSTSTPGLETRVQSLLQPLGFNFAGPIRDRPAAHTVVYDTSGGRYPQTAAWMEEFFGATVVEGPPPRPIPGMAPGGLEVVMGTDFARRWFGLA